MIIRVADEEGFTCQCRYFFYSGIIADCSCAADPTPVDDQNEYCEVQIEISKKAAEVTVALLEK